MTSREAANIPVRSKDIAPSSLGGRLRILGPGLVLAATTVGVGDLVSSLVAGERFGTAFIWAIILAAILKYFMTEALGRWHLASGDTIIGGWDSIGRWATAFVTIYLLFWAFIYGAAGPSVVGLAANAAVPALPREAWAIIHSLLAFAVVWLGRYHLFETIMKVLIGAKLLTVLLVAVLLQPDLGRLFAGLVPTFPQGSLLYAVGIVGGLGGTLALASYGYWVRDKGWRDPSWMPVMRLDTALGYVVTGLFGVSVMVIGTELFFGTGRSIGEAEGLPLLAAELGQRFGSVVRLIFLAGFWSIAFASVMGVWNGMSYLFSDLVRTYRGIPDEDAERHTNSTSPAYRFFLFLLTFPTIPLILFGRPVGLVIFWATLGAIFLPFLSLTLLYLLNSGRVAPEYRSRTFGMSNIVLAASVVVFLVLAGQAIADVL